MKVGSDVELHHVGNTRVIGFFFCNGFLVIAVVRILIRVIIGSIKGREFAA